MNSVLRPMRLGEILDRTFAIYRGRFWVFFGISAFPAVTMMGLQFVNLFWWKLRPPDLIKILGVNFGMQLYLAGQYHCSLFFHALAWPWICCAGSHAYLGDRPSLRSTLSECGKRWKSWIGLALLVQFIVVLVAELAAIAVMLGGAALGDWLSNDNANGFMDEFMPPFIGSMIVIGVAFSLWLGAVYLEAIPAWGAEHLKLRRSFKRSRLLSKGSRWRVTSSRVVPVVMVVVLNLAASASIRWVIFALVKMLHHSRFYFGNLYASAYLVCAAGISALLGPVFPIALTLLYYDQRIRKEGFDIEWMMKSAGMAESVAAVPAGELGV